jgi:hypothetical protein
MSDAQDTPQTANDNDGFTDVQPFGDQGSESNNISVEDAFFGTQEEAPAEGQPSQEETVQTEAPAEVDPTNDEKRYQYWQSRADKLQNEMTQMQQQMQQVQQPQQVQQQQYQEPAPEEFPPPPDRPMKPRNFSRAEAYSDPDSESARYLDDLDDWRAETDEYNSLKSDYNNALVQERIQGIEQQRLDEIKRKEAFQQQSRQAQEIDQYVQGHYGLSAEESKQFMQEMSDPKSLSMDNLVQLWRMKQSVGNTEAPPVGQPSPAFQQTQNAQQVPSPMGVMPSSGGTTNQSDEDQIMDKILSNYNKNNPWS